MRAVCLAIHTAAWFVATKASPLSVLRVDFHSYPRYHRILWRWALPATVHVLPRHFTRTNGAGRAGPFYLRAPLPSPLLAFKTLTRVRAGLCAAKRFGDHYPTAPRAPLMPRCFILSWGHGAKTSMVARRRLTPSTCRPLAGRPLPTPHLRRQRLQKGGVHLTTSYPLHSCKHIPYVSACLAARIHCLVLLRGTTTLRGATVRFCAWLPEGRAAHAFARLGLHHYPPLQRAGRKHTPAQYELARAPATGAGNLQQPLLTTSPLVLLHEACWI